MAAILHPTAMPVSPTLTVVRLNPADIGLLVAAMLLAFWPAYDTLHQSVWHIVGQGHGPVMLALTLWLIWQRWSAFQQLPDVPAWGLAGSLLIPGLLAYIVGRSQDVLALDVGSQILILAGLALAYRGPAGLRLMWLPLFFMLFLVPLPGSIVDTLTAPLKSAVSHVAELALHAAGYPIGRSGVTLTIGPYHLLVADACAGLNSVFSLEAIGVFYMSVIGHTHRLRNVLLAILILPISFVSNVTRVIVLVLITYHFGDEAGQGFVHGFAGILLFMVATALTIASDSLLGLFLPPHSPPPSHEA
jgi:exosortase B